MATKKKTERTAKTKGARTTTKRTAKKTEAPKLSAGQLAALKRIPGDGIEDAAFDRRTLNSLKRRGLVSGGRRVKLTAAGLKLIGQAPALETPPVSAAA